VYLQYKAGIELTFQDVCLSARVGNFERKDIVDDYHTHAAAGVTRRLVDRHVSQHGFAPIAELARLRVFSEAARQRCGGERHTHTDNDR
jgi:hypothetical protein